MNGRIVLLAAGGVAAVAAVAGATSDTASSPPRAGNRGEHVANAIGVGRGTLTVLRLPHGGAIRASCGPGRLLTASFVRSRPAVTLGVVASDGAGVARARFSAAAAAFTLASRSPATIQTWQISEAVEPFTRVTTVSVSSEPGPQGGCWVSAHATTTTRCHGPPSRACAAHTRRRG